MKPEIQTISGRAFNFVDIKPESICIEDIACALANSCRYTGHCRFYSVAEHSIAVSHLVHPDHALEALLHDGSEAYLSDISTPAKQLPELAGYRIIEKRIQDAIYKRFGISGNAHSEVKLADDAMLAIEAHSFYGDEPIDNWGDVIEYGRALIQSYGLRYSPVHLEPHMASAYFLERFYELGGKAA